MPTIEQRIRMCERDVAQTADYLSHVFERIPSEGIKSFDQSALSSMESQLVECLKSVVRLKALRDAQCAG
jgi:hypothetical protein